TALPEIYALSLHDALPISFGPWLLRIVANETRNLTRSRRRRAALALRLVGPDAAVQDGPVDEVLAAERRAGLVAAVNALPDRERSEEHTSELQSRGQLVCR